MLGFGLGLGTQVLFNNTVSASKSGKTKIGNIFWERIPSIYNMFTKTFAVVLHFMATRKWHDPVLAI